MIAGVELGGTKCVCLLGTGPDDVRDEVRIATTTPAETLAAIEAVLDRWRGFAAIGIASFGPLGIDRGAADYGHITATTKPGWSGTDVAGRLGGPHGVPVGFHTDVVGAALAEARWGAGLGLADLAYITVGTGVGVGLVVGGAPLGGMTHAELGHIRPVRVAGDEWPGACSFHGACVEGLAAGPAIAARTGLPASQIAPDAPVWPIVADALGQLCQVLVLTGMPRRIVIGGGVVIGQPALLPMIRRALARSLGSYGIGAELGPLDRYVVLPGLGNQAGPLGAILLGAAALDADISKAV